MLWTESPGRWGLHHVLVFLMGIGRHKGPRRTKLRGFGAVLGRVSAALERENASRRSSEPDSTFECHSETQPCHNVYEECYFPNKWVSSYDLQPFGRQQQWRSQGPSGWQHPGT